MGKKKRSKEDNYEHLAKKLKKIEKKLKRRRKNRHDSAPSTTSSDNDSENLISLNNEDSSHIEDSPIIIHNDNIVVEPTPTDSDEAVLENCPSTSRAEPIVPSQTEGQNMDVMDVVPVTDSAILELLGDDPSVVKSYGKDINTDLAVRLEHIVTTGLAKEIRKELQDKYLPPQNCMKIDAPALNPEIKAAVNEIVLKRDKGIEVKQKVLGAAVACLGEAITIMLDEKDKNTAVIKLLMDASRLICDCQNTDSNTRRNFILYNVKKDMKSQLQKTKIDNFLFSSELSETLKTAKNISKSSADLKIASAPKPQANKRPVPVPAKNNLNWKTPPPTRRFKVGTQRMKEPTQKNQHANFSRNSYRPAPPPPPPTGARTRYRT